MAEEVKGQDLDSEQTSAELAEGVVDGTMDADAEANQESEIETLRGDLAESRDQLMRIAAEFDNFKKRMERERDKLIKYAGENILRDLLATLDNLDRAVDQGSAPSEDNGKALQALLEGVVLTRKGLVATLERYGVEPLAAIGQPFNPDEHDALTMEASDEVPANHVLREFARGYRFKDRVLRHAQVVVSSGPQAAS